MAAVAETSGLKSLESDSSVPKSAVDDDDDELEALRTAALLSMKAREKSKSGTVNSEARERPGSYSNYSRFHHSNQRATTPGKPLFSWNQHTRPNLIVIQPVPLEGSEAASPCSVTSIQTAQPSTKLVLPQDRWCPKRVQDGPTSSVIGQSKRRASGKFSHFESSSESEESDDDDLLRSGSASSHSDASADGHSSDDEQNSTRASPPCRFAQDCLDSCLSESTSDLPAFSSPRHDVTSEACATDCVHKSSDERSPVHAIEHGCNVDIDNAAVSAQFQACGDNSVKCATKDLEGLMSRMEASVHGGHEKINVVPNENTPEVLFDCSGLQPRSGNASPVMHTRKSPAMEERQQKYDEGRLTNGLSTDSRRDVHLSPDITREDRLARERHSSREGTPGSTRSVDSQDRSASSVFEARRRKFESTVPVKPVGGKILLLRQGRTEDQSPQREGSPLSSPCARTRSRSRSTSPPLLRSVLSVVKRGTSELLPAGIESKKKHRPGRTVEIVVHSVGEESTEASERIGNSGSSGSKLPVHLRLGDASTASSTRKKKSKRKRSSHDSAAYSVKRKHAKARGLDSDVRRAWLGPDQRCRRKRMQSALSDGAP